MQGMCACMQIKSQGSHHHHACTYAWTHWDLNPRPSACEADVIPLHHVPKWCSCGHVNIQHILHETRGVRADMIIGKDGFERVTMNSTDVRITGVA